MTSDAFLNIYSYPIQLVWPSLFLALLNGSLVLLGNAYRDALAAPQAKSKKQPTDTKATVPRVKHSETSVVQGGLLGIRDLWVRYPQPDGGSKDVVRGISLDVASGEIVGLVGESGSGKTQTGFSILGLLPPEARVHAAALDLAGDSLLTKDQSGLRALRGSVIAYIPQEPMSNLDPSFTVGSQLVEGLSKSMSRREAKATVLQLLARVGITDPVRTFASYPHQISGGMAQRVLIAGAVATRPKLLIADEPTTALDVTVQAEILDLLRDLQGEYGMGVLLITHNFGVVADLCDRVLVMRSGELVESGDVRSIFHQPQHGYTQELIASILDEDAIRSDAPLASTRMEETR
jgi:peptide/nickel transport system permease protein